MGEWTFPVGTWRHYKPTRSQEYRADGHHGVDIMFKRDGKDDVAYQPGTPNGSRMFFMPDGVPVYAARSGTLWSAGRNAKGGWVTIDHGKPYVSFYLHLDELFVPATSAGANRMPIAAGQQIGTVGYSELDGERLKHLHFEIWEGGASESHVDPWPYISGAPLAGFNLRTAAMLGALAAAAYAFTRWII